MRRDGPRRGHYDRSPDLRRKYGPRKRACSERARGVDGQALFVQRQRAPARRHSRNARRSPRAVGHDHLHNSTPRWLLQTLQIPTTPRRNFGSVPIPYGRALLLSARGAGGVPAYRSETAHLQSSLATWNSRRVGGEKRGAAGGGGVLWWGG